MINWLFKKMGWVPKEKVREAYEAGLQRGYTLGYNSGVAEKRNRGVILGSNLDREVETILGKEGF